MRGNEGLCAASRATCSRPGRQQKGPATLKAAGPIILAEWTSLKSGSVTFRSNPCLSFKSMGYGYFQSANFRDPVSYIHVNLIVRLSVKGPPLDTINQNTRHGNPQTDRLQD